MTLNLSDLIDIVQLKNRGLPPTIVEAAVRRVFREIIATLEDGGRVELRGFGTLEVRRYEGHEGRNPRTGAPVTVSARKGVQWKTGKGLAKALNASEAAASATPDP